MTGWTHVAPIAAAAFLASFVEFVEALTVVLAVGTTRGWRAALIGAAAGLAVLLVLVAALGSALARIPLGAMQFVVGLLLLLFGLRWLRKAILRAAGVVPRHDEAEAFAARSETLRAARAAGAGLDRVAAGTAFNIVMLEGVEVVFIVVAVGAGTPGGLLPAALGALAALGLVALLGLLLHRPLATVPENLLKFIVGVLLTTFGTFWVGEGLGLAWPGGDAAIPGLIAAFLAVALLGVRLCTAARGGAAARS